jgi:hypothetical protein
VKLPNILLLAGMIAIPAPLSATPCVTRSSTAQDAFLLVELPGQPARYLSVGELFPQTRSVTACGGDDDRAQLKAARDAARALIATITEHDNIRTALGELCQNSPLIRVDNASAHVHTGLDSPRTVEYSRDRIDFTCGTAPTATGVLAPFVEAQIHPDDEALANQDAETDGIGGEDDEVEWHDYDDEHDTDEFSINVG